VQLLEIYVLVLAAFVGYMVISRVPPLLHTPLMAATNAISGISLVGSPPVRLTTESQRCLGSSQLSVLRATSWADF